MDEVSAKAKLATAEPGLTVSVPMKEVVAALDGEGADLVLDVLHTNGDRQARRVTLAMEQETLKQLVAGADGEQVLIAIDPESLAKAFDEVEGHGLREMGATLAIVVTTVAGGTGMAQAYPADGSTPAGGAQADAAATISPHDGTGAQNEATAAPDTGGYHQFSGQLPSDEAMAAVAAEGEYAPFQTDFPVVHATVVEAGMPRAMPADYAQARASEEQMPRAMPSDYAAAAEEGATLHRDPGAVSNIPATTEVGDRGIENIRASQPPPAEAPDPAAAIEAVRIGGTAVPDPSTAIENVRAQRGPAEVGGGGATISAPSTGAAVAIAGGAMLTIAAAAFALRRRREPGLA
jgi:hypothetical protein